MCKPNLVVIVEGQTETNALNKFLSPHLYHFGLFSQFPVIGTPGRPKGGHKSFDTLARMVSNFSRQYPNAYITTFFDYYALNPQWPGVKQAKNSQESPETKAKSIEQAIKDNILGETETLTADRFMPYIQLHEFEALLFADTDVLGDYLVPHEEKINLRTEFTKIKNKFLGCCESINDNTTTAPSKRIEALAKYRKGKSALSQAAPILERIGLEKVRETCPRFNAWLTKLENLQI